MLLFSGVQVYHTRFQPLEFTVPHRGENACYAKLICNLKDNVSAAPQQELLSDL